MNIDSCNGWLLFNDGELLISIDSSSAVCISMSLSSSQTVRIDNGPGVVAFRLRPRDLAWGVLCGVLLGVFRGVLRGVLCGVSGREGCQGVLSVS